MPNSIEQNLAEIERLYQEAQNTHQSLFYSKLAILELCGWLEMEIDKMMLGLAQKRIKKKNNLTDFEKKIVKRTYGFSYDEHIRKMMIALIGIVKVEKIESKFNAATHQQFLSAIGSLEGVRNTEAHTFIDNVQKTMAAPSQTKTFLSPLQLGIIDIKKNLYRTR